MKLDTSPVPNLCIFPMMVFVVNNRDNFQTNLSLHGINMRHKINCTGLQQILRVAYSCKWIFNTLPANILKLQNVKSSFKMTLRRYLIAHTFIIWINFFLMVRISPTPLNYNP